MTIKKIVYCEGPDCSISSVLEVNFAGREGVQSPWMTVTYGSASWSRHFCRYECLRGWADQQILNRPLRNLSRVEGQFKVEEKTERKLPPSDRDVIATSPAAETRVFERCHWHHCIQPAVEQVRYESRVYRYCHKHAEDEIAVLLHIGVTYGRTPL